MLDPAIPIWPRALIAPRIGFGAHAPTMSGPQPLDGAAQSVISSIGHWRMRLTNIPLRDAARGVAGGLDRRRLFDALFYGHLAVGRPVYLPPFDCRRGPRNRAALPLVGPDVPHSDDALFSDDTPYTQDVTLDVAIGVAAPAGASVVYVDAVTGGVVPIAGDFIGLDDRFYKVTGAWEDRVVNRWRLALWPRLRYAQTPGARVELAQPVCKMVLDPADRQSMIEIDLDRDGAVTLNFIEANWTP